MPALKGSRGATWIPFLSHAGHRAHGMGDSSKTRVEISALVDWRTRLARITMGDALNEHLSDRLGLLNSRSSSRNDGWQTTICIFGQRMKLWRRQGSITCVYYPIMHHVSLGSELVVQLCGRSDTPLTTWGQFVGSFPTLSAHSSIFFPPSLTA